MRQAVAEEDEERDEPASLIIILVHISYRTMYKSLQLAIECSRR